MQIFLGFYRHFKFFRVFAGLFSFIRLSGPCKFLFFVSFIVRLDKADMYNSIDRNASCRHDTVFEKVKI